MLPRIRSLLGQLTGGRMTALVYLGGSLLGRGASIVLIPLYTRTLSVPEYGHLGLWNTVVLFFVGLGAFGMQSAVPREFFSDAAETKGAGAVRVARWALAIASLLAVVGMLLTLAIPAGLLGGLSAEESRLAIAAGFGVLVSSTLIQYLKARQAARVAVMFELAGLLTGVAFSFLLVVSIPLGVYGALLASCLSSLLVGSVAIVVLLALPSATPQRSFLSYLQWAVPTVPHFVAVWLLGQSDRWALQVSGEQAQLGIYTLALTLTSPGLLVMSAFHDAYGARIGEMFREGGVASIRSQIALIRRRYFLVSLLAWLTSCAATLVIATLAVSSTYRGGVLPALLLGLLPLFDVLYFSDSNILYYSDRTKTQSMITTSAAVISVGAMMLGARFGMWGVLLARALGLLLRSGMTAWAARHRAPLTLGSPP